jgi:ketosteroid isomerase-like protein
MRKGLLVLVLVAGCGGADVRPAIDPGAATDEIHQLLDAWHRAASDADMAGYLGPLADDAVFMGTDATERWSAGLFAEFVAPYFEKGQGWTYTPSDRHVMLSRDGRFAWFDEKLDNDKYGELRGTGVLRLGEQGWELVHYSMSFPVPNDVTKEVVALIRGEASTTPEP